MFLFRNLRYLLECAAALLCYLVLDVVGPLLKFIGFCMAGLHWSLVWWTNHYTKPFFQDPEEPAGDNVILCCAAVTFMDLVGMDLVGSILGFIIGVAVLTIWPTHPLGIILSSVCGLSLIGWIFIFSPVCTRGTFDPIE